MTYRRRHRWLRRLALGLAFATFAAPAAAKLDEGGGGSSVVTAGGWTGMVDTETGIPLSAGIPQGDEAFIPGVTFPKAAVVEQPQVISYLSHGLTAESVASQQLNHRQIETLATENGRSAPVRPDDRADRFTGIEQPLVINYLSHGMTADDVVGARPDDKADRFAHSDVAPQPELASGGWNVEWNEAFTVGIGALVLMVALGLGLSYLRRPRLTL
jgi:hypothetical protein